MLNLVNLGLLLANLIMVVSGQFLMKFGVSRIGEFHFHASGVFVTRVLLNGWIWGGIALYGISTVLWIALLSRVNLSVAYPMLSLAYIAVIAVSAVFFKEPLTLLKVVGTMLIIAGIVAINRG